jgi:dihydrofolate reductase
MAASLNGIIATPAQLEDFLSNANWQELLKLAKDCGCLIWGRKTYALVSKWDERHLAPLKEITKIVVSRDSGLQLLPGYLQADSPEAALTKLASLGFSRAVLSGGAGLNSSFAKAGLLDEIIIDSEGIVVGKGIPLFAPEVFQLPLELLGYKTITDNILQLHYRVKK